MTKIKEDNPIHEETSDIINNKTKTKKNKKTIINKKKKAVISKKTNFSNLDLNKYLNLLLLFNKLKLKEQQTLINHLDDSSINFLCEFVFNIIIGNIAVSKHRIKNIKKKLDKKTFKYISDINKSFNRRKNLIKQNGSGLNILIKLVPGLLKQLVTNK